MRDQRKQSYIKKNYGVYFHDEKRGCAQEVA